MNICTIECEEDSTVNTTVRKNALKIIQKLRESGFEAYIVGGAVRDMILGIEPEDYDIATSASCSDIERLFEKVIPVGAEFGVCQVILGGKPYEVAGFRKDGVYEDGRRPSRIEPASAFEDVSRRDFTINALLYDPLNDRIIDHVNGRDDVKKGIIRTVGNPEDRFHEDSLRMLRAVRFATRFHFTIEPEAFAALQRNASLIQKVSCERIGDELSKMFTGPDPARALTLLDETGLLAIVLPEVAALKGVLQPAQFHPEGDVFEHTRYMLELFGGGSLSLAFGILLHDVGKPVTMTETDRIRFNRHDAVGAEIAMRVMTRLRLGRDIIKRVQMLVKNHMRFMNVRAMRRSTLMRFIAMDEFDELLELYRLDCLASHGSLDVYEFIRQERDSIGKGLPKPLLTGDDLMSLGYKPGKKVGVILRKVMDKQLEGTVTSRDEALDFVLRNYSVEGE